MVLNKTILCIDDEMMILKSLERCLLLAGYDVRIAKDGAQGLSMMEDLKGKVNLIIMDYRMPEMSGDEVLARINVRFGNIPSIMLSGCMDEGHLMPLIVDGKIDFFLEKPWDNGDLLSIVETLISDNKDDHKIKG